MHVASCASLADCWISGFHWEILLSTSWTRLGCLQPLYKCQLVKSVKRSFLQRVNRQLKGCVGISWNMSHRSTCIKHCFTITCTLDTHTHKNITKHPKHTLALLTHPKFGHSQHCQSVQTTNAQVDSSHHVGSDPARPPRTPSKASCVHQLTETRPRIQPLFPSLKEVFKARHGLQDEKRCDQMLKKPKR